MITKKIRFEVFKRDGFKCAYCGHTPPDVILEIDHIEPKSKGGKDDINNYITACFDCNRGKRNIPLSKIPLQMQENLEILQEKEDQIKAYRKLIDKIDKRIHKDIEDINTIYASHYRKWRFTEQFERVSIKKFLSLLPKHEVEDSLSLAISKFPKDPDKVISYFCGICWNKIKGKSFGNS